VTRLHGSRERKAPVYPGGRDAAHPDPHGVTSRAFDSPTSAPLAGLTPPKNAIPIVHYGYGVFKFWTGYCTSVYYGHRCVCTRLVRAAIALPHTLTCAAFFLDNIMRTALDNTGGAHHRESGFLVQLRNTEGPTIAHG
jgi:hypothetical protein